MIGPISFWSSMNVYHLIRYLILTIYFIDQFLYFHYLILTTSIENLWYCWSNTSVAFSIIQMRMNYPFNLLDNCNGIIINSYLN